MTIPATRVDTFEEARIFHHFVHSFPLSNKNLKKTLDIISGICHKRGHVKTTNQTEYRVLPERYAFQAPRHPDEDAQNG